MLPFRLWSAPKAGAAYANRESPACLSLFDDFIVVGLPGSMRCAEAFTVLSKQIVVAKMAS